MKTIHFYILLFCFVFNVQTPPVYITKTGKKFHKTTCNYLKYSKQEIDLEKAKNLGYLACKVCKPENLRLQKNNLNNTVKPIKRNTATNYRKTTAVQCSGKTKSNKRCKRRTKNSNGRCYQH